MSERIELPRIASWFLAAWIVAGSLALAWTTLATMATYGWEHPTQDQYRLYRHYLERPFPESILQIENQHRPIVPGLVRVAEIHLRDADQGLQLAFGTACVLLLAAGVARAAFGAQALSPATRAAGAAAGTIGLFWLGNARILLHGNEIVHVGVVGLCALLVAWCSVRAARERPARWLGLGALAAATATFTFGPGIALFPALLILAWLQRVPARWLAIPVAACVACLLLYVWLLPGDDNVRLALALRPTDIASVATRWLASPWINAWLGHAEPAMFPWQSALIEARHPWLVASANAVQNASGLRWSHGLSLGIGGIGLAVLATALLQQTGRREPLVPLAAIGLALMLFGAACAAIIGIGRIDYLLERPDQVFADRYLPWPCLFWIGVAAWLSCRAHRAVRGAVIAFVAALPFALWPTHQLGAGWGASVHRSIQGTAAAARSDVLDPDVFWRDDPSVRFEDKLRTLELLRERRLAMFAPAGSTWIGQRWEGRLVQAAVPASLAAPRPASDVRGPREVARFDGVLPSSAAPGLLAVLDDEGVIRGYAQTGYDASGAEKLRWWPRRLDGFDAFVRDYDPRARYRLVALDVAAGTGTVLGEVPRP